MALLTFNGLTALVKPQALACGSVVHPTAGVNGCQSIFSAAKIEIFGSFSIAAILGLALLMSNNAERAEGSPSSHRDSSPRKWSWDDDF
jgi:hypothetical protein